MHFRLIVAALAACLFAVPPAAADIPLQGTFLAQMACPAVQSIKKGTNPGNITLRPQQTYRLVSANNDPASHYLVIVPGASPEQRWVEIGCGKLLASSDAITTLPSETPAPPVAAPAPATVPAPAPAPAAQRSTGNSPTHFVLSISWEPGFCAGMSGKPECRAETPTGFDASHFTLHGLWPDPKEYCGAARDDVASDKASDWRDLPAVDLSTATRTRLAEGMPGTQSLLERHEWLRHGTCSGVSADAYFSRALGFLDSVNASPVQSLFAGNVGETLTLDAIRSAFDKGFGNGAGDRIRLSCSRDRRITEITIGLDGDVMGDTDLPTLIAAARPTNGGCDRGSVTAVR